VLFSICVLCLPRIMWFVKDIRIIDDVKNALSMFCVMKQVKHRIQFIKYLQ
jgi:hypothetical protein